jgi:predicted nucleic acid-binding protein
MAVKYLLDTSLWRDFYEDRVSKSGRPLGKYASDFFVKLLKRNDEILYSEALVWELKKDYDEQDIQDMLTLLFLLRILRKVEITKDVHLDAKRLALERKIPYVDCLNAVLARDHKAILVSQDEHIITDLKDIAETKKPEWIK